MKGKRKTTELHCENRFTADIALVGLCAYTWVKPVFKAAFNSSILLYKKKQKKTGNMIISTM